MKDWEDRRTKRWFKKKTVKKKTVKTISKKRAKPMPDARDEAITSLTGVVDELTAKLKEQDDAIQKLVSKPAKLGKITHILPGNVVVVNGSAMVDLPPKLVKKVQEGCWVHIVEGMGTLGIVDVIDIPEHPMTTMKVAEVLEDGRYLLDIGNGNLVPIKRQNGIKAEVGDRILLGGNGPTDAIALENLGKDTKKFQFSDELNVSWDDIGGLELAKRDMIEAIEYPIRYASMYKAMGKKPIKGVLLEGPSGCGKTLLAKAAAGALAAIHGKSANTSGYIYVKGPEVLSKWVGEAEATIRSLFAMAREHKAKHGYPAIVFIDESDALLGRRGSGVSSDMEKTIVPSFLAELDGLTDSGAMVILATNLAHRLDSAIVRDGRIDRRIRIGRPDEKGAAEIFGIHLRKVPSCHKNYDRLATHGAKQLFDSARGIAHVHTDVYDKPILFTLGHCASGAMIAGVVDRATSIVLHERIANNDFKGTPVLESIHIDEAVKRVHVEMMSVDHRSDIDYMAEQGGAKVRSISRAVAA